MLDFRNCPSQAVNSSRVVAMTDYSVFEKGMKILVGTDMPDYSVFEKGMKISAESDGKCYPLEAKAVSKTSVKICFVGYVEDE